MKITEKYFCRWFSGAKRDEDGYIWITGRIDDMVNVSGHLLSTAEIESALIEHEAVAEAAVVSHPHTVKGECTYAFVTLIQVGVKQPAFKLQQMQMSMSFKQFLARMICKF